MKVLVVEPNRVPYMAEIKNSLDEMQKLNILTTGAPDSIAANTYRNKSLWAFDFYHV